MWAKWATFILNFFLLKLLEFIVWNSTFLARKIQYLKSIKNCKKSRFQHFERNVYLPTKKVTSVRCKKSSLRSKIVKWDFLVLFSSTVIHLVILYVTFLTHGLFQKSELSSWMNPSTKCDNGILRVLQMLQSTNFRIFHWNSLSHRPNHIPHFDLRALD